MNAVVELLIDGQPVRAPAGASLLVALEQLGLALTASPGGSPRGAFCAMGVCQECRVRVDGRRGVLACLTEVREGMRVERRP
ncbi:MAG: (2Fe-2S)-binding protein [Xanthomonadales bacterium]|nr:(2Fe-2S)-binding protein [Xanthomonadales bacterium]